MPVLDTFPAIVGDVHAHSLGVDSLLVEGWVRDTWAEIERLRTWSHLRRQYQIVIPAPYTTGTCTLTPGSPTVTLTGSAVASESWIGRQFQRAVGEPIHDITHVDTGLNTLTIFPDWNFTAAQVTLQSLRVFTAYISVPQDFFAWISIRDTERRRRLNIHVTQDTIDLYDPKRSYGSRPYCVSGMDWTRSYSGRVYSTLRVNGSGPGPVAGGAYNGQYDALIVVKIVNGGVLDTATFSYATDAGAATTTTISSAGNSLPNGVSLLWPTDTFVTGNIFIIRVSANTILGMPRYELYPHPTELMVLNATYSTRPTDPEADGWVVPSPITGDMIALNAKGELSRYPGTNDKKNPFAQIGRATEFRERFEDAIGQALTMDEYIIEQNVTQMESSWPYYSLPWSNYGRDDVLGPLVLG